MIELEQNESGVEGSVIGYGGHQFSIISVVSSRRSFGVQFLTLSLRPRMFNNIPIKREGVLKLLFHIKRRAGVSRRARKLGRHSKKNHFGGLVFSLLESKLITQQIRTKTQFSSIIITNTTRDQQKTKTGLFYVRLRTSQG